MSNLGLTLAGSCDEIDLTFGIRVDDDDEELIDLERASFIKPAALVGLVCFASFHREWGRAVRLRAPYNLDVANYLARTRLGRVLEELGVQHDLPTVREHVAASLWELQSFSRASEVYDFAEHIHGEVSRTSRVGADELFECLCEAGENVGQHSGQSRGYLTAQRYKNGRLVFAVGDAGLGFLHGLRGRGASTDAEALQLALEPGVSSVDDRGRGYGLHEMARSLSSLGGTLSILSGRNSVRSSAGRVRTSPDRQGSWQGAVVSGTFPIPDEQP